MRECISVAGPSRSFPVEEWKKWLFSQMTKYLVSNREAPVEHDLKRD
jgi:hypothetical protein